MFHQSVLVETFLQFFEKKQISVFLDGTLGAGGHSLALLEKHSEIKKLYGLDRDPEALQIARNTLKNFEDKIVFVHGDFQQFDQWAVEDLDGIFLDLGVSSMQLDQAEKGFSLYKDGPLDMRMNPHAPLTAAHIVNHFSEQKLAQIFWEYGEEPKSRRAAKAIVEARAKKKITTTQDLINALKFVMTWSGRKGKKIHPMTLIFQALRIYVNDELNVLAKTLPKMIEKLAKGGRLGVLSFHSLEDRIVKNIFRDFAKLEKILLLTKKPLVADDQEMKNNPRSRSAKLRFVEKL